MPQLLPLILSTSLSLLLLAACSEPDSENLGSASPDAQAPAVKTLASAVIPVKAETEPTGHEANAVALWVNPGQAEQSRIYGTGGTSGIEIYNLSGKRLYTVETGGELKALDILPALRTKGGTEAVVIGLDVQTPKVLAYAIDAQTGNLVQRGLDDLKVQGAYEGLCAYRSPLNGEAYIFLTKGSGEIEQWWLESAGAGNITARPVRRLNMSSEVSFCTTDPVNRSLYVSEKEVGIWRINADIETEPLPELIDVVKFGNITQEVGGLAVYRDEQGQALLVASHASDSSLHFYDINADHALIATATLTGEGKIGDVEEAGGIAATGGSLGNGMRDGLLVVMDDDNGDFSTNYKILPWDAIEAALPLAQLAARNTDQPPQAKFVAVRPTLETAPVGVAGDAADDPAIWVHPEDPGLSTIIGTDKQQGLYVYGLDGKVVQFLADGMMNNVDIRHGFPLDGTPTDIVTASNRTDNSIAIYKVDPKTRKLISVADGVQPTGMPEVYGLCMYQNPDSRATYVFVNDKSGLVGQWELKSSGDGKIHADKVREVRVDSQPEGCVADDDHATLFVGEEDVALWKFSAAPGGGAEPTLVARITDNPAWKDDFEGVSIYYGKDGAGYLILSSQGNDSYAVFDRQGDHAYLGSFVITANGELDIDGASETDGLDVISTPLGEKFPYGAFVAQDGRNLMPSENQNYKVVPWEAIADALGLDKHTGWSPRR